MEASLPLPLPVACDDVQGRAPELDAACVTHILRFVAPDDFRAASLVNRLWRSCASDTSLPVWKRLNHRSFMLLAPKVSAFERLDELAASQIRTATKFTSSNALKAVRRLRSVLTELDLRGLRISMYCGLYVVGHIPISSSDWHDDNAFLKELVSLIFSSGAPQLSELTIVDLAMQGIASSSGLSDHDFSTSRVLPPALPQLKTLSILCNEGFHGSAFERILLASPSLENLYLGMCSSLQSRYISKYIAPRPTLRVNLMDNGPLPRCVDVLCGICRSPMWRGLTSFAKAPPTQPHIAEEWYTNTPPTAGCVTTTLHGDERMVNCANRCHEPYALYLVDAGTGAVELHGWKFGIAVGDGTDAQRDGPPLALIAPKHEQKTDRRECLLHVN
jgi:hypothetical protein